MEIDWGMVMAGILSIGVAILAWRKAPHENRQSNGNAAESYAQASKIYADENIDLRARLFKSDEHAAAVESNVRGLKDIIKEQVVVILDEEDWNTRLCHQILMLGEIPVLKKKVVLESKDIKQV